VTVSDLEFKQVLGRWPSGVTVVTAYDNGVAHGMTASSFTSVSLHPPLISVCLDRQARTLAAIQRSDAFAVNVLGEDQAAVSVRFASTEDEAYKFERAPTLGARGCPLIAGAVAQLECSVFQQVEAGDHIILLGAVEQMSVGGGPPLLYLQGKYGRFASL
jgi:flavin reductase (DIM6/NTAB) family NADH-FMN oxidoreductase RutF